MKDFSDTNEIIKKISMLKPKLSNDFGVISIGIFGSYSKNLQTGKSDIDVLIDLDKNFKTFDNFMNLKFYLEKITGKKIDLATTKSIRNEFRNDILKDLIYA